MSEDSRKQAQADYAKNVLTPMKTEQSGHYLHLNDYNAELARQRQLDEERRNRGS